MKKIIKLRFTKKIQNLVYKGFHEHAIETIGASEIYPPVCFVCNNENNEHIAIIVFTEFWGAVHIKYLWVHKNYRKAGYAINLMDKLNTYSKKHKYKFAFVETMNFQAVKFYKKLGFIEEFVRHGYSHNTSLYYMRKDFI